MANAGSQNTIKRSNRLLFKKFSQYLLPTTITYAAVSLNEFADSMLVSNLLGSGAMAVVGLGMPVMLAMAGVYSLLGSGGATVYGISVGKRDNETAGKSLTAALAVEEMGVYAAGKKRKHDYMDILVRIDNGNVVLDYRSLGAACNPLIDDESDMPENVRVLRSVATRIESEYILGMNSTRIVI